MKYIVCIFFMVLNMNLYSNELYPQLLEYCNNLNRDFSTISEERKEVLDTISKYLKEKIMNNEEINLTFICTHNSRRSHFGQVWAKIASIYYGINNLKTYSGGTEVTACNIRTIGALQRVGFVIDKLEKSDIKDINSSNPLYILKWNNTDENLKLFSKKYTNDFNPKKNFAAIIVCSSADEACPVVFGADERYYLPYEDPKKDDNTENEAKSYDNTCRLIAKEMFYLFNQVINE